MDPSRKTRERFSTIKFYASNMDSHYIVQGFLAKYIKHLILDSFSQIK
jgi:hypothetical protein